MAIKKRGIRKIRIEEIKKVLRHSIFGAEDGLVSTLGFLTGVTGAGLSNITIIIAGSAEVFAAALSMGVGTYLSTKSQIETYQSDTKNEKYEMKTIPDKERKEIEQIYKRKGFKGQLLKQTVDKIVSNKKVWLNEMLVSELGITPSKIESPLNAAITMFITFVILAMIPLSPYLFLNSSFALNISSVLTFAALFIVGAIKTKITKRNWFRSGLEMMLLGFIVALATYYLGKIVTTIY